MESFSKIDIFDTKGIEYLVVIGFLLILVLFWRLSKLRSSQQFPVWSRLTDNLLRIPQGLFFGKTHTWIHLEKSGLARVGIDDFLQLITGKVIFTNLKLPGDLINKGDLLAEIEQNGKNLKIYSPVSGEINDVNYLIISEPGICNDDPYGDGWLYEIKPMNWVAETNSLYLAEDATNWAKNEMTRFKDFVSMASAGVSGDGSNLILQDGGEIRTNILSEMPAGVWSDFQKEFLDIT